MLFANCKVEIYTDGACSGNPGNGGYGIVIIFDENNRRYIQGSENPTTNNRMELKAVIESLKNVDRNAEVTIYSDSSYVILSIKNGWLNNWIKDSWLSSTKKPVANQDLWMEYLLISQDRNINFIKVKGHSNNKWNDCADKLAKAAIIKDE